MVTLADERTFQAEVLGSDYRTDVALVKIEGDSAFPFVELGDSDVISVGDWVIAIGNPFGLDHTLTTGIISGLGREIESRSRRPIRGVIQTDAAINPGNSGGPLLDSSGRLIGINTAIASPTGAYAGVGFAVPADTINRIVPQLIDNGFAENPGLGVHILPSSNSRSNVNDGVMIHEVIKNSPAYKAGLRGTHWNGRKLVLGDLIVELDGSQIQKSADLFEVLDRHRVGDVVSYQVLRQSNPPKRLQGKIELQALR